MDLLNPEQGMRTRGDPSASRAPASFVFRRRNRLCSGTSNSQSSHTWDMLVMRRPSAPQWSAEDEARELAVETEELLQTGHRQLTLPFTVPWSTPPRTLLGAPLPVTPPSEPSADAFAAEFVSPVRYWGLLSWKKGWVTFDSPVIKLFKSESGPEGQATMTFDLTDPKCKFEMDQVNANRLSLDNSIELTHILFDDADTRAAFTTAARKIGAQTPFSKRADETQPGRHAHSESDAARAAGSGNEPVERTSTFASDIDFEVRSDVLDWSLEIDEEDTSPTVSDELPASMELSPTTEATAHAAEASGADAPREPLQEGCFRVLLPSTTGPEGHYGVVFNKGPLVRFPDILEVRPDSVAANAGLAPGCRLVAIAGVAVTTFDAARQALADAAGQCTDASPLFETVWRPVPEGSPPTQPQPPLSVTWDSREFPCRMGKYRHKMPLTPAQIEAQQIGAPLPAGSPAVGGYGQVVRAINGETGERVCIKLALQQRHTSEELREVILQACLQHEFIVPIKDFLFDRIVGPRGRGERQIGVVMEIVGGGEVFEEVLAQGGLPEATARRYFRQILLAMAYCHARGVAHRDMKLENLLLTADKRTCKVADFGLAKNLTQGAARTIIGTARYVAPEMLTGQEYDAFKTDMWACGVCLFCMTERRFPFSNIGQGKGGVGGPGVYQPTVGHLALMRNLMAARYRLSPGRSPAYAAFLERLLCVDAGRRYTAIEALSDPWMLADNEWSVEQAVAAQQTMLVQSPAAIPGNYETEEAWMAQVAEMTGAVDKF